MMQLALRREIAEHLGCETVSNLAGNGTFGFEQYGERMSSRDGCDWLVSLIDRARTTRPSRKSTHREGLDAPRGGSCRAGP